MYIHPKKQVASPVILCDHCHERIEKADQGLCLWHDCSDEEFMKIYFVHQDCNRPFERNLGKNLSWQKLDHFMLFLSNSLEWSREDTIKKIKPFVEAGFYG